MGSNEDLRALSTTSSLRLDEDAARWDARAEQDIGVLIARYLSENPAPSESVVALDLRRWSSALRSDGQARLVELGSGRLRAT